MKTTLILILAGALIGVVAASYIVPPALAWYTEPGGLPNGAAVQSVVQVPQVIHYAVDRLLFGQLIGGGIGATIGLVLGIVLNVKGRRRVTTTPA